MNLAGHKSIPVVYAAGFAFALFLLFWNLGDRPLWSDEAETAVLAKNTLCYGFPKTVDGFNHITLYGSATDSPDNIWTWSPWLQEYLAAGSFAIFGPTTWAARAPFALIAGLSLVLLARVSYKVYGDHRVALASVAVLGTSEIFLLHARQCRYYAISVFCEILLVYGIHLLLTRDKRSIPIIALALTLQFYSNYLITFANLPALAWLAWILLWRKDPSGLWLVTSLGILLAAALPWAIYAQLWQQFDTVHDENPMMKAWYYLREFNFHFLPMIFLLLPFLPMLTAEFRPGPKNSRESKPAVSTGLLPWERFLLLLLLLYAGVICLTPGTFLRYLLPILPVACVLCTGWLFRYVRSPLASFATISLLCVSNAGSFVFPGCGEHPLRWPLFEYIGGITEKHDDRFTAVLRYLGKNARPGESVLTFDPEFALMFHTRLKVIDAALDGNNTLIADSLPDWILAESASGLLKVTPVAPPAEFADHYERLTISVPDSSRIGVIPEPDVYQYHTATNRQTFTLFRKRTTGQKSLPGK